MKNWVGGRISDYAKWLAVSHKGSREAQNDSYGSSMVTGKMKTVLTGL